MTGFIDFHSHVLPAMDDGSQDMMESLSMLKEMAKQGTAHVCATSHYYSWDEDIPTYLQRRGKSLNLLPPERYGMTVQLGAEVAYFDEICKAEQLHDLCLTGTDTLLLELPFKDWPRRLLDDIQRLTLDMGYRVVLAHPERYLFSRTNRDYLRQLADGGIAFQVNADTFLSWRTRKDGLMLLQMTENPLLGTDAHNLKTRAPRMQKAREVIEKKLGPDFLGYIDDTAEEYITP